MECVLHYIGLPLNLEQLRCTGLLHAKYFCMPYNRANYYHLVFASNVDKVKVQHMIEGMMGSVFPHVTEHSVLNWHNNLLCKVIRHNKYLEWTPYTASADEPNSKLCVMAAGGDCGAVGNVEAQCVPGSRSDESLKGMSVDSEWLTYLNDEK